MTTGDRQQLFAFNKATVRCRALFRTKTESTATAGEHGGAASNIFRAPNFYEWKPETRHQMNANVTPREISNYLFGTESPYLKVHTVLITLYIVILCLKVVPHKRPEKLNSKGKSDIFQCVPSLTKNRHFQMHAEHFIFLNVYGPDHCRDQLIFF